jgi:hypothetical protein
VTNIKNTDNIFLLKSTAISTTIKSKPLLELINQYAIELLKEPFSFFKITLTPGNLWDETYNISWRNLDNIIQSLINIFESNGSAFFAIAVEMHRGGKRQSDITKLITTLGNTPNINKCFLIKGVDNLSLSVTGTVAGYPHLEVIVGFGQDLTNNIIKKKIYIDALIQSKLQPFNYESKQLLNRIFPEADFNTKYFVNELKYLFKEHFLYDVNTNIFNFSNYKRLVIGAYELLLKKLKQLCFSKQKVYSNIFFYNLIMAPTEANLLNKYLPLPEKFELISRIVYENSKVSYDEILYFLYQGFLFFGIKCSGSLIFNLVNQSEFTYKPVLLLRDALSRIAGNLNVGSRLRSFFIKQINFFTNDLTKNPPLYLGDNLYLEFKNVLLRWSDFLQITKNHATINNLVSFNYINFDAEVFINSLPINCLQVLYWQFFDFLFRNNLSSLNASSKTIELLHSFCLSYGLTVADSSIYKTLDVSTKKAIHIFGPSGSMKTIFGSVLLTNFFGSSMILNQELGKTPYKLNSYFNKKIIVFDEFSWRTLSPEIGCTKADILNLLSYGTIKQARIPYKPSESRPMVFDSQVVFLGTDSPPLISNELIGDFDTKNQTLSKICDSQSNQDFGDVSDNIAFLRRTSAFPFSLSFIGDTVWPNKVVLEGDLFIVFCANQFRLYLESPKKQKEEFISLILSCALSQQR